MACTKLRCNLAAGELRQDDELPCGTKVVPIMAAISPLIIIEQEGSHRRRSFLSHINLVGYLPLTCTICDLYRYWQRYIIIGRYSNIKLRNICQEKNAYPLLAASPPSGYMIGRAGDPFQRLAKTTEDPLPSQNGHHFVNSRAYRAPREGDSGRLCDGAELQP
jgi:hypothetical protein